MVASEAMPFAKTGGLADVIGALAPTLAARGEDVAVLLPRYRGIGVEGMAAAYLDLRVRLGPAEYTVGVYRAVERNVPYFLADCPPLYDRAGLYGDPGGDDYPDNHLRFAVLARVALTMIRDVFRPDVIHCHDWQAALVPILKRTLFAGDPTFMGMPVVLTIHNLGYQGLFPKTALAEVSLDPSVYRPEGMEFFGQVSYIKAGIEFADAVSTVSPTYAREIQTPEFGCGLDGCLRDRGSALSGILNGVDYADWSPQTDAHIAARYSAEDLSGKAACKRQLLDEFGLPPEAMDRPLAGIVSRFTRQKGADILAEIAARIVAEDVYLVALGTGEPE